VPERNSPGWIPDAPISVEGYDTVGREAGAQKPFALNSVAISWDHDWKRMYEVRRNPQKRFSFFARFADALPIRVLKVTNPAVDHFEAIGGGGMTKVSTFDQCHGQTPQRAVPGSADTEDTAPNDYEIVFFSRQRV